MLGLTPAQSLYVQKATPGTVGGGWVVIFEIAEEIGTGYTPLHA